MKLFLVVVLLVLCSGVHGFIKPFGNFVLDSVIPKFVPEGMAVQLQHSIGRMRCFLPISRSGLPFISHKKSLDVVRKCLEPDAYGLHVIHAPKGCGKTVSLTHLAAKAVAQGRSIQYYSCMNGIPCLYQCMGVSKLSAKCSGFLPVNTTVILDHVNCIPNAELREMVTRLATDSTESRKFNVVMAVSEAFVAASVLAVNKGLHIHHTGQCEDFKWGADEIDQFIKECPKFLTLSLLSTPPSILQRTPRHVQTS